METYHIGEAFCLTLFAGLSTGIGSGIAFFSRKSSPKFLSSALGFSAGVMIYVSFVEIFAKAKDILVLELGQKYGTWLTTLAFFSGLFFIAIIDRLVPSFENPHEVHRIEEIDALSSLGEHSRLYRIGLVTALAIGLHNFPEGLATFTSALKDPALGVPIALAIAIHNIPEGIAVSVPIFYSTRSKNKAFYYSFLSGLAEPAGALLGYFLLFSLFNDISFGMLFASVAGIMVFISLDELLPAAEEYGEHHLAVYGLIAGMIVMALSLSLFL